MAGEETDLSEQKRRFDAIAMPHLSAAFNLARWLLRNDADAEDAVQDAFLRAFRYFGGLRGDEARPWLLGIVRNVCYGVQRERGGAQHVEFDEERDGGVDEDNDPQRVLIAKCDAATLDRAIESLPIPFREVIVLRELEELSYQEIALVAGIPLGTVMSRLARARALLKKTLAAAYEKA